MNRPIVIAMTLVAMLHPISPAAAQSPLVGRFEARGITIRFTPERARFTSARGLLIDASYRIDGPRITFRDDSGAVACPGQEGSYEFRLSGDTLRFRLVNDGCAGRPAAMAQTWMRISATVLTHATLIDGTGAPARANMTVVLENGRITAVYADGAQPTAPDARVVDLRGKWLLPGLVDAHVHVATNPSTSDRRDRVERRLRNALRGGVVLVRDMAGDARALADLARAANAGDIESPAIVYSALVAGPNFFNDPRVLASSVGHAPGAAPWTRAVVDTTDLRQLIAEARGTGARGIKMYADLSGAQAALISAEAKRQRMMVWSHLSLMPARPSDMVKSGVQVVSHANLLAWEATPDLPNHERRAEIDYSVAGSHPAIRAVIDTMRARNVLFEPTLFVFRAPGNDTAGVPFKRQRSAFEMTRAVHAGGVRIVAGTDGMGSDDDGAVPNIHEEMRMLVQGAGLPPMAALVAATRNAAEAAGMEASHGTVAVGKAADLLVLDADPLADINNTRRITMVFRRGVVVAR